MALYHDYGRISIEEAHQAIAKAGGKPSRIKNGHFSFNSRLCHPGGDNPAGCWAKEKDGQARLICHKCKKKADAQIRQMVGLPEWKPGYTADKPGYAGKVERKDWEYNNPSTGEVAIQRITYYPEGAGKCPHPENCPKGKAGRRCKHPYIKRDKEFDGKPIDGFSLRFHAADNQTHPFLTICEGQDAADKAAAAGYPGLSYIGGSENAGKADYMVCQGQRIAIIPDNDVPGTVAALTAAVKALEAGATGIHILDPVNVEKGADLSDVSPNQRQFILSRVAQQSADQWITDISPLRLKLALAIKEREIGRLSAQDGRVLIPSHRAQDFREHQRKVWKAMVRWNKLLASKSLPPLIYRNEWTPVEVAQGDDGLHIRRLDSSAGIRGPSAEAILWHRGFAENVIAPESDPETEALAVTAYRPSAFGRIVRRTDKKGNVALVEQKPVHHFPDDSTLGSMIAAPSPAIPHLKTIVTFPYVHNGGMVSTEGYNPKSEVYLAMGGLELKPMTPAEGAKAWRHLLQDFAFATDADFASAVALAITPIIHEYTKTAPATLITKPAPRTGASLLASIIAYIITGREPEPTIYETNRENMKKSVMSLLMEGKPIAYLDNVVDRLDDPSVNAVLTTTRFSMRELGTNKRDISAATTGTTWVVTGNRVTVGADFAGRALVCELNAQTDKPGERTGPMHGQRAGQNWAIPNIKAHVEKHRGFYLSGLVGMVAGWLKAGRPAPRFPAPGLGGFEEWLDVTSGVLAHAGINGLLENREQFVISADEESADIQRFVQKWWDKHQGNPILPTELETLNSEDGGGHILDAFGSKAISGYLTRRAEKQTLEMEDGTLVCLMRGEPKNKSSAKPWVLAAKKTQLV